MTTFETINASTSARSETLSYTDEQGANIIVPHSLFKDVFKPSEPDILPLIRELEDLKKSESRFLWHSITLSEYWCAKRIPRGLRISKIPSFGLDDKSFMHKWELILNKCSLDLMLLIIEKTKSEQAKLKTEVKRIEDELKSKVSAETFAESTERISTALTGFVKDLQMYKMKKYERDTRDYADGAVYEWQGNRKRFLKSNRPPLPKTNRYMPLSTASERESSDDLSDVASGGLPNSNSTAFLDRGYKRPGQRQRRGEARGGRREPPPPTRWSPRNHQRRL